MHTFVVRVYPPGTDSRELRGVVDEVASGASSTFRDSEELVRILARAPKDKAPLEDSRDFSRSASDHEAGHH